ncbi:hypothetical protein H0H81_012185 [Sphagnurus paluster]|uniref:Uncharacterized protein n=1 Tax=Sphagnurus paluster TaxID=117069 RepID=A0A9P7K3H6_9AGAR|nr:hypothetical protein H0H81_012185 [Sphagnurus paluster]
MATEQRELNYYQRNLIDTCFEEGQFDSALDLLEQMRSPNTRLLSAERERERRQYQMTDARSYHTRQVIYIALQPDHPEPPDEPAPHPNDVPPSPSKSGLKNSKKGVPSGAAVVAARRLLQSYALTNDPESIALALPSFGIGISSRTGGEAEAEGSLESAIGPQAMRIAGAKSAWNILSEGFANQGRGCATPSSPVKGRKRTHRFQVDDEDDDDDDGSGMVSAPVGPDAWAVLEWLVFLFEQDEKSSAGAFLLRSRVFATDP